MKGIARSHGKAQRQARAQRQAKALAAVRATAAVRAAPWETARSRNRQREPPGAARWISPCSPFSGTACSDAQSLIR